MDCIKTIHPIEDGLCDFLFFESLYRLCGGEILEPQLSVALKLFVGFAKGASKTEYGVSIDASNIQDFTKHLKIPDALAWVDTQLWQNKVYHWGIMTIHEFHQRTNPGILKDALAALNVCIKCLYKVMPILMNVGIIFNQHHERNF
ncbi:uncharacterized protein LOC142767096 [Rhipicephalus microplus]|uniref:uncharacterized protein LOC142767096 n=1 Tax=Rhipicephalus microplus TaxID=6941 RepID=UPI003F6C8801